MCRCNRTCTLVTFLTPIQIGLHVSLKVYHVVDGELGLCIWTAEILRTLLKLLPLVETRNYSWQAFTVELSFLRPCHVTWISKRGVWMTWALTFVAALVESCGIGCGCAQGRGQRSISCQKFICIIVELSHDSRGHDRRWCFSFTLLQSHINRGRLMT